MGFVNRTYADADAMLEEVMSLALEIAGKSPVSIRGTKEMILYTRDHTVAEGLNYIATWNAAMLLSDDLREALTAKTQGRDPLFED